MLSLAPVDLSSEALREGGTISGCRMLYALSIAV